MLSLWRSQQRLPSLMATRCKHAPFFDPGKLSVPNLYSTSFPPSADCTASALAFLKISRLNSTAYLLVVYASPAGSPLLDARLTSDCWLALSGGFELLSPRLLALMPRLLDAQPRWVAIQGLCSLYIASFLLDVIYLGALELFSPR